MERVKHQRLIGAGVILFAIGVVAFMLFREGRKIGPGMTVHVEMGHAGPLVQGSKVRVAGLTVGQVDGVSFLRGRAGDPARVSLKLWISRRHAWLLHEKSEYFVNQPGLLAEAYLEVGVPRKGDPGPPVKDGAVVQGVDPSSLDEVLNRSYAVMRALDAMMRNEFPELGQLGDEIDAIAKTFSELSDAPVWKNETLVKLWLEATQTQAWFAEVQEETERLPATITRARALVTNGRAAIGALRERVALLTERIDGLRASVSPERLARLEAALAQVDGLTRRIEETLASADALVALVESGQGSLAAFAADMEIADEVKAVTKMLKEEPWKLGHPLTPDKKSGL